MAEQFANKISTTVATAYVAASGTLIVASATGMPATGTFRLRLGNLAGTILIVQSRVGTTLTVTVEQDDGNADVGDSVRLVNTAAAMLQLKADAIAGAGGGSGMPWWPTLTPLDQSAWAWVNQGGFSVVQANGIVYLAGPASGAGNNNKLRVVAAPATPFTITALVIPFTGTGFSFGGIGLRNAASGRFIHIVPSQDRAIAINRQTNPTTFASTAVSRASAHGGQIPLWLRMTDDGTNVVFAISPDGRNFTTLHTELRTAFINTPDQVAITAGHEGAGPGDGGGVTCSWVQT